jgi:parvulin-like peptidyl-prolyl isomerase
MAKKQKKTAPERTPTKHQLSKWQRQERIRRIVIIAAIVLLVGISSWVGYGYYRDYRARTAAWREVMIEVNGVPFTMEYFVKVLDAFTQGMNSTVISQYGNYLANIAADTIIDAELLIQGAASLNITVTDAEVDAQLEESGYDETYRDLVKADLLQTKLTEQYFGPQIPDAMEQADAQVVFVESEEVATELISEVEAGGNFTVLAAQVSCNSSVEGDLGWLPEELMPNSLIANAAFNSTLGEISQPIYEATAVKEFGYWLIEVTYKQDDQIDALAMLLGSKAEAEWIGAELAAGGNFSALAGNYSQHQSKTKGGKLDGLEKGDMGSTAFDAVAFNLAVNEVSEPVKDTSIQTTGGYWLVKVIDRGERELADKTREDLINKHLNDWRAEWTAESTIETYLEAARIAWAIDQVLQGR